MARKGIREYDAKRILSKALSAYAGEVALVGPETKTKDLLKEKPWLGKKRLVVKPDQLFGKRGKHGLIAVDKSWAEATKWIEERMNKEVEVGEIKGTLSHFLVEPFVPHEAEYYVAMRVGPEGDTINLSKAGGVNVEECWDQVGSLSVPVATFLTRTAVDVEVAKHFDKEDQELIGDFMMKLYEVFVKGQFSYLEINPFTIVDGKVLPLDAVAKLDDTAEFECQEVWGNLEFPIPFGRSFSPEEAFVNDLDSKTGASLKLSVLNPKGNIWTMVAGGGASVIYADTISDLGFCEEMANYGEYSGNPNAETTYQYAKTILDLMTREKDPKGRAKYLLIGGGIANFTDVAKTFGGIIRALEEYAEKLKEVGVEVFVRRGGPNYKVGLERMRALGEKTGVPVKVFGPEAHITKIVSDALAKERN
ncbi:MAG: ATPase [Deltaproteobacteria bacterium]|nr:ATPase [Deltaproteobacteria bacterium]